MSPELYNACLLALVEGVRHILEEPRVIRDAKSLEDLREYLHEACPLPAASRDRWFVEIGRGGQYLLIGMRALPPIRIQATGHIAKWIRRQRTQAAL